MSNQQVHSRGAKRALSLSNAILIYGSDEASYATVNPVQAGPHGQPVLMPGRLAQEADLMALHNALIAGQGNAEAGIQWINTNMLARGHDRMIWWTPEQQIPLFFEKSSRNKKTFTASGLCPLPAMVWMARPGDGLYVYALKSSRRPEPKSQLYQAPLFNVWSQGRVCVGSAKLPSNEEVWSPTAWQRFLLESNFTHPNFTQADRLVKGVDPCTFWKQMCKQPTERFPKERLVNINLKVEDLLALNLGDRLARIPKATGEF